MTLEDALPVALALPVADERCVTCPTPVEDDPVPNPISANSDKENEQGTPCDGCYAADSIRSQESIAGLGDDLRSA